MSNTHEYYINLKWTGNLGKGTETYRGYSRNHIISIEGKEEIEMSADKLFRGDVDKYTPEEMLVASVASCHMLWYLHLCADNGVVVIDYSDKPIGKMIENPDGSGRFEEITLYPEVLISDTSLIAKATELHHRANKMCFIANSLNFEVKHETNIKYLGNTES